MAMQITKASYDAEITKNPGKTLVDFWAPWCMPCRMIAPVIDELSVELAGKVTVGKVNTDEEPALAAEFGVMAIPMLAVVENGKIIAKASGVRPKAEILELLGL